MQRLIDVEPAAGDACYIRIGNKRIHLMEDEQAIVLRGMLLVRGIDLTPELLDRAADWIDNWVVGSDGTESDEFSAGGDRDKLRTIARALRHKRGESDALPDID